MGAKKANLETAGGFFDDITPRQDVQTVQGEQGEQSDKRAAAAKKRSNEARYGVTPVHIHATVFPDDFQALKDIAWEKRLSMNGLIRDIIIPEYVKANKE